MPVAMGKGSKSSMVPKPPGAKPKGKSKAKDDSIPELSETMKNKYKEQWKTFVIRKENDLTRPASSSVGALEDGCKHVHVFVVCCQKIYMNMSYSSCQVDIDI